MSNVQGWASEPEALTQLPSWLCHWERAVMLLVGAGVQRSDWPSPYLPDSSPEPQWMRATEEQRRALLPKCEALRCEIHPGFARAEIESAIRACREKPRWHGLLLSTSYERAVFRNPRAITTEDARYICAEDATAQLLHQEVLPHRWPPAYELADANGKHPVRVPNESDGARRLFTGNGSASLYVLAHELRQLLPNVEVVRNAADALTWFNGSQRNLQHELAGRNSSLRPALQVATTVQPPQRAAPTATLATVTRAAASRRAARRSGELDEHINSILKERPNIDYDTLTEELFERYPGSYNRSDNGGVICLITGKVREKKAIQNRISRLRRAETP